ncbi:hypothetical protein, partial [Burkholderia gladioli]|uniref:hypothetical protein n=1 Tax=Burkholderia gladioli TaxID=28095 RepID=UPI001ABB990C
EPALLHDFLSPLEAILSSFNWSENHRAGQAILFRVALRSSPQGLGLWVVLADARTGIAFERRWNPAAMALAAAGAPRAGQWLPVEFVDER